MVSTESKKKRDLYMYHYCTTSNVVINKHFEKNNKPEINYANFSDFGNHTPDSTHFLATNKVKSNSFNPNIVSRSTPPTKPFQEPNSPKKIIKKTISKPVRRPAGNKSVAVYRPRGVRLIQSVDETVVINLDRRLDRKMAMIYKLSKLPMKYSFCQAVDGQESWVQKRYVAYQTQCRQHSIKPRIRSAGALACCFSFFKAWRQLLQTTSARHMLFLEDDVAFHLNFNKYEIEKNILEKYDVIYLGYNCPKFDQFSVSQGLHVLPNNRSMNYFYGTFGFLISRKFLDFVVNNYDVQYLIDHNLTIDVFLNRLRFNNKRSLFYFINEALVVPDVSESDIRDPRDQDDFNQTRGYNASNYQFNELNGQMTQLYRDYLTPGLPIPTEQRQLRGIPKLLFDRTVYGRNKKFVFIVASYNNNKWYQKNLDSILSQTYPFYTAIYIDDASTDKTINGVENYLNGKIGSSRFTLIGRQHRMFQSYSRYFGYQMCNDGDICVFLDGDDWLTDGKVLAYLNNFYQDRDLQVTYQNYLIYHNGTVSGKKSFKSFPPRVLADRSYRQFSWTAYHLRTCQASLIKQIDFRDFIDLLGNFVTCCSDVIEANCYLELVDHKRHAPTDQYLLVYNKDNSCQQPNSSYSSNNLHQQYRDSIVKMTRSRSKYQVKARSRQLFVIDINSPDYLSLLGKYHNEMSGLGDLLVIPVTERDRFSVSLSKYRHIHTLTEYTPKSRHPKSRARILPCRLTCIVYIDHPVDALPSYITDVPADMEVIVVLNGVQPRWGIDNRVNTLIFRSCSVDECLRTAVACANGEWVVTADISTKILWSQTNIMLSKIRDDVGLVLPGYRLSLTGAEVEGKINSTELSPYLFKKRAFHLITRNDPDWYARATEATCYTFQPLSNFIDPLWFHLIAEKTPIQTGPVVIEYLYNTRDYAKLKADISGLRRQNHKYLGYRRDCIIMLNRYYEYMKLPFTQGLTELEVVDV